jgi:quercetin dioxygenase-like cupin family protein
MEGFTHLGELVGSLAADPATTDHPIKRQFLCDGEFLTANLAIIQNAGNALHTQPHHDEVVVVLDGEVDFRVGDTTRRVQPGDLVFIPRTRVHGPILAEGDRLVALSVFAPHFDPGKPDNFVWERDTANAAEPEIGPGAVHSMGAPGARRGGGRR